MTGNIHMKTFTIGLVFLLSFSLMGVMLESNGNGFLSAEESTSRTWIVDNEGDGDFKTIQSAIAAADPGDMIKIYSGVYYENILVNTENLVLTGIDFELGLGSDSGKPIIDGNYKGSCIILDAEHTSLTCCIIQHCGNDSTNAGIEIHTDYQEISGNIIRENGKGFYIYTAENSNIIANDIFSNIHGVVLHQSDHNSINGNSIYDNDVGVILDSVKYDRIEGNDIYQNRNEGIYVNDSWYNTIYQNTIYNNSKGIIFNSSKINDITENTILDNDRGIHLFQGNSRNNISDNTISDNRYEGVLIEGSSTITMFYNILNNNYEGIVCNTSSSNEIKKNTLEYNTEDGIALIRSDNNELESNVLICNRYKEGIVLTASNSNSISFNDISNAGVTCYQSMGNSIIQNDIKSPMNGIYLNSSDDNIIIENTITLSNFDGIYLGGSNNNNLYHNFLIDNHRSAFDTNGVNIWDNGYPDGGNYWSDYDQAAEGAYDYFSGPNQDNSFSDGIVDTPYEIPGGNAQDRYPFYHPWGEPETPTQPQGSSYNIKGKSYRYSTSSTDPNGDMLQYGWDWDGDKSVDEWTMQYESGETIYITHAWAVDGEYRIHVKAMDENGVESDWSDPLSITVPKMKTYTNPFIPFLIQNDFIRWIIEMFMTSC